MKKVIFVCTHNSGRSQMAEAFARRFGEGIIESESAGTQPVDELNATVVEAMEEIGYDMSGHYPKLMTSEIIDSADRMVTMGCGVDVDGGGLCPIATLPTEDWGLDDPKDQPIEKVRRIRDEIESKVKKLIAKISD